MVAKGSFEAYIDYHPLKPCLKTHDIIAASHILKEAEVVYYMMRVVNQFHKSKQYLGAIITPLRAEFLGFSDESGRNAGQGARLFFGHFVSKCPFFSKTYRGTIKTHLQLFVLFFNGLVIRDF